MKRLQIKRPLSFEDWVKGGCVIKTEVLSQEEINELLTAINAEEGKDEAANPNIGKMPKQKKTIDYSFEKMAEVNKDMAQEMIDNFTKIQEKFINHHVKEIHEELTEMRKHINRITEENNRMRRVIEGTGLFDDDDTSF